MGYYVLVFVFGLIGSLSTLRALEILVFGGRVQFVMFLVGLGSLYLAKKFLTKARGT